MFINIITKILHHKKGYIIFPSVSRVNFIQLLILFTSWRKFVLKRCSSIRWRRYAHNRSQRSGFRINVSKIFFSRDLGVSANNLETVDSISAACRFRLIVLLKMKILLYDIRLRPALSEVLIFWEWFGLLSINMLMHCIRYAQMKKDI